MFCLMEDQIGSIGSITPIKKFIIAMLNINVSNLNDFFKIQMLILTYIYLVTYLGIKNG